MKEHDNKLDMNMIINGKPYPFTFPIGNKLRVIVEKVLDETKNSGQPLENWELRDSDGTILDLDKHLKEYNFVDGVNLFLNTRAGIGGLV